MNVYDELHKHPKKQIDANIDLIMDIAQTIGEIRGLFPHRNLGEPMPSWNLNDFKIHYLGIQNQRERVKRCIRVLQRKHEELNKKLRNRR